MSDRSSSDDSARTSVTRAPEAGSSTLSRLLLIGLAVGIGVVLVKQMPDLKRYLKMKQM